MANFDKIYVFEPNPLFYDSYDGSNYQLIKKAIWIKDERKHFYISKDTNQVSSSLLEEKFCKVNGALVANNWSDCIEVECINFSNWINNNFSEKDKITLKLDIEGAEFDVLSSMIEDKSINKIENLYVEFHVDACPNQINKYEKILNDLKDLGIEIYEWD